MVPKLTFQSNLVPKSTAWCRSYFRAEVTRAEHRLPLAEMSGKSFSLRKIANTLKEGVGWVKVKFRSMFTFLDVGVNCTEKCLACSLVTLSWFCATIFFPCGICSGMKCVNEYERLVFLIKKLPGLSGLVWMGPSWEIHYRAVIFRLGRLRNRNRAVGPGLFCILPCVDTFNLVDLRTIRFSITSWQ